MFTVIYTESHPDRESRFIGVFSTEEKADAARDRHMASEKASLPRASINEWNYSICESDLDQEVEERI